MVSSVNSQKVITFWQNKMRTLHTYRKNVKVEKEKTTRNKWLKTHKCKRNEMQNKKKIIIIILFASKANEKWGKEQKKNEAKQEMEFIMRHNILLKTTHNK